RSVGTPELLQNTASGDVGERGERGIEAGLCILNHMVQYLPHELSACKGRLVTTCEPPGSRTPNLDGHQRPYRRTNSPCNGNLSFQLFSLHHTNVLRPTRWVLSTISVTH